MPARQQLDRAAVARGRLARFLTWALRREAEGAMLPRIPTRRVSEGGFTALLETEAGKAEAARWWASALAATPTDPPRRRRRWRR